MKFVVCVLSTLLIFTMALPVRKTAKARLLKKDFLDAIKRAKDAETYRRIEEAMEMRIREFELKIRYKYSPTDDENKELVYKYEVTSSIHKGKMIIIQLLKATTIEGAKPTEEELTGLAKRFAKTAREDFLKIRALADRGMMQSDKTIDVLKEIIANNPLNITGNNFLGIFKEKLPKIYIVANLFRTLDRQLKKAINDYDRIQSLKITMEEDKAFGNFMSEFMYTELLELFKSDESAIEVFKNFGIFMDTIKTASSYDSLQAFYNGLARSKSLEAYAILVREAGKCLMAEITQEERAEWKEHFDNAMKLAKMLLADGQDTTSAEQMAEDFESNDVPVLEKLWNKMKEHEKTEEGRRRFRKCLLTESDRQVYSEALELADVVLADEQLNAIKQKNEKMYAVISILNSQIQALSRREGLGAEAAAYLKEATGMKTMLLALAEYFHPSQGTLEKIAAMKKTEIERFNKLSVNAKKEIVDRFPFHIVLEFSKMD